MTNDVLIALISSAIGPVLVVVAKSLIDAGAERGASREEDQQAVVAGDPTTITGIVLTWAQTIDTSQRVMKQQISDLRGTVSGMEIEIAGLKRENEKLRRHNELLSRQVTELGGTPWRMP